MNETEERIGWAVIIVGLLLLIPRLMGTTHIAYQAAAHIYMGGIIVAFVLIRKYEGKERARYLLNLSVLMSLVETAMAMLTFFFGIKSII